MMRQPSAEPLRFTRHQRGLTLVEIMIALTLSLVLLAGMLQIYLGSKQTYRVNEALSRLQEGGRIAMDLLAYDIRMAGFQGCADPATVPVNMMVKNNPPTTDLFQDAIGGSEGDDNSSVAGADSDTISIMRGESTGATPVGAGSDNANIQVDSNPGGFKANDILIVSDCEAVDIFRATTVSNAGGKVTIAHAANENDSVTTAHKTSRPYNDGKARLMRFVTNAYSVAPTGRNSANGAPIRALFRTDVDGTQTEIVDGVEYLEVLYGQRLSNDNVRYVPANDADLDMSEVISVRLGLLLVSDDAVLDANDTRNYPLVAGATIQPGTTGAAKYNGSDRRMRRVFTTTVRLRNRR